MVVHFSFQKHAPVDHAKNSTADYVKTFEDTRDARKDMDKDVPLIPKPPSFEMAVAAMNAKETNNTTNNTNSERKYISGIITKSSTPTDTHHQSPSTTKSCTTSTSSTSTAISSSASLTSGPLLSLKSLYNDAKMFYQTQAQKEKFDSSEKGK